jgi:peptidyl-prolyl cis-trans isomerase SurA
MQRLATIAASIALAVIATLTQPALAERRIVATVYDQPITSGDVDEYLALQKLLGVPNISRKDATEDLINQVVKIEEAKANRMQAEPKEIEARLGEVAKGLKTDQSGLNAKLKKQGVSLRMMEQFVAAQIGFSRLLKFKYKAEFKVNDKEVDSRLADYKSKIKAEIDGKVAAYMRQFDKFKPVTVYSIQEIVFPLGGEATNELFQARALDAVTYSQKFRSCKNARAAASGIFNVQVKKPIEADASKLPPPLRKLLRSKGPGNVYGPMRSGNALQMVAFCGQRTITPPKPKRPDVKYPYPTRDQVANLVVNESYRDFELKYVNQMRQSAIIEYKTAGQ